MGTPFFGPRQDWVAVEVGDPPMQERRLQVHDARTGAFQLDVPVGHPVDDAVFGPHGDGVLTLGPGSGERKGRALDVWRLGHWDRLRDDRGVVLAASVELGGPGGSLVIGLKNAGGQEFRDPASGALRDAARYPDDHGTLSREAAARLGYKGSIAPYALAPDGNTLVASDRDGGVVLLDRRRDGPGRLLHRHPGRVTRLVFDPRGQWLASAAYDVEGDVIAQPADGSEPPVIVVRGAGRPERFHFVDSARWLMVGDTVWDIVRRVPVASFSGQGTRLAGLDLAPTGDAAAWLFDDGSVRLGRWSAPALVREVCGLVARNLGCEEWRRHYGDEPYRATCTAMPAPVCDTPR
jgi:WD40 repeat protein